MVETICSSFGYCDGVLMVLDTLLSSKYSILLQSFLSTSLSSVSEAKTLEVNQIYGIARRATPLVFEYASTTMSPAKESYFSS